MRIAITAILLCGAFGVVAPAAPISFSGSFAVGDAGACCVYDMSLTGTDGFLIGGGLPDWLDVIGGCPGAPCDASGVFNAAALNPFQFNVAFGGQFFHESPGVPNVPVTIAVGGMLEYTAPPFPAPDCVIPCFGVESMPMTFVGDLFAQFLDDGSYLFDLDVSGTGTLDATITNEGSGGLLIRGVAATSITGTGTPIPEPATALLILTGAAVLILRKAQGAGAAC